MSTRRSRTARTTGQRAGLSRDAVVDAARRVAEGDGVDGLTMRRLASELGVMPNAVYSYFEDKDALLDALLDRLLSEVEVPEGVVDWRDGISAVMDSSRRLLLRHPGLVAMFLSRPALGPNAARLGEATFGLLRRGGLDGERAVEAFRVVLIYTLGFAAFQAPRQRDSAARTRRGREAFGGLDPDVFPELRRVAPHLAEHPSDANFRTGLGWLLDGMVAEP